MGHFDLEAHHEDIFSVIPDPDRESRGLAPSAFAGHRERPAATATGFPIKSGMTLFFIGHSGLDPESMGHRRFTGDEEPDAIPTRIAAAWMLDRGPA